MTPIDWLMSGDTGTSSKTICSVMTGSDAPEFGPDVPHDADDFGRCYRLLELFPEWRGRLPEVAAKYPKWGPMVVAWDELSALYEAKDYDRFWTRIQALEDEGRIAAGWKKTGPNSWSGPGVDVVEIGRGVKVSVGR